MSDVGCGREDGAGALARVVGCAGGAMVERLRCAWVGAGSGSGSGLGSGGSGGGDEETRAGGSECAGAEMVELMGARRGRGEVDGEEMEPSLPRGAAALPGGE